MSIWEMGLCWEVGEEKELDKQGRESIPGNSM